MNGLEQRERKLISDIKNEINESEKLRTEAKILLDNAQKKLDTAQKEAERLRQELAALKNPTLISDFT